MGQEKHETFEDKVKKIANAVVGEFYAKSLEKLAAGEVSIGNLSGMITDIVRDKIALELPATQGDSAYSMYIANLQYDVLERAKQDLVVLNRLDSCLRDVLHKFKSLGDMDEAIQYVMSHFYVSKGSDEEAFDNWLRELLRLEAPKYQPDRVLMMAKTVVDIFYKKSTEAILGREATIADLPKMIENLVREQIEQALLSPRLAEADSVNIDSLRRALLAQVKEDLEIVYRLENRIGKAYDQYILLGDKEEAVRDVSMNSVCISKNTDEEAHSDWLTPMLMLGLNRYLAERGTSPKEDDAPVGAAPLATPDEGEAPLPTPLATPDELNRLREVSEPLDVTTVYALLNKFIGPPGTSIDTPRGTIRYAGVIATNPAVHGQWLSPSEDLEPAILGCVSLTDALSKAKHDAELDFLAPDDDSAWIRLDFIALDTVNRHYLRASIIIDSAARTVKINLEDTRYRPSTVPNILPMIEEAVSSVFNSVYKVTVKYVEAPIQQPPGTATCGDLQVHRLMEEYRKVPPLEFRRGIDEARAATIRLLDPPPQLSKASLRQALAVVPNPSDPLGPGLPR